jgi:hypothetical protein
MRSGDRQMHDREGFRPEREPDSLNRRLGDGEDSAELGDTVAAPAAVAGPKFSAVLNRGDLEKLKQVASAIRSDEISFYKKRMLLGGATIAATSAVWDVQTAFEDEDA